MKTAQLIWHSGTHSFYLLVSDLISCSHWHYNDVILSATASQVTGVSIVYSTICSGADQRKHKSCASLVFDGNSPVTGGFPTQRQIKREMFHLMTSAWTYFVTTCLIGWVQTQNKSCYIFASSTKHFVICTFYIVSYRIISYHICVYAYASYFIYVWV